MERAKRECILVEAAKAFARFGFRKASIDQIAKKAGVAKGTVYLAAESKEDLFYQVLHREVRSWIAEVSQVIDPRVPADQLLAQCSQLGLEYLEARPLVKELLFGQAHLLLPNWGERLDELVTLGRENVVQILKLGTRQGLFRADLDVDTVAELLLDLQLAYFVLHDRGPNRETRLMRRKMAAFDLVLNGIKS
jgi:TetR/AcrR family transcriptional regulator, fatty acid metabolism regulator protein